MVFVIVISSTELRWQTTLKTDLLLWKLGSWPLLYPQRGRHRLGLEIKAWGLIRRAEGRVFGVLLVRLQLHSFLMLGKWNVNWKYINHSSLLIATCIAHGFDEAICVWTLCFKDTLKLDSCSWGVRPHQSVRSLITLRLCESNTRLTNSKAAFFLIPSLS